MRIWPNMSKNIFFLLRDRVVDIAGIPVHGMDGQYLIYFVW